MCGFRSEFNNVSNKPATAGTSTVTTFASSQTQQAVQVPVEEKPSNVAVREPGQPPAGCHI